MAIALSTKTNVEAPSVDYPYGSIKDNTGLNDGTPVNRAVYTDMHQFFQRLLDQAGITANGLPDNATNTYQLFLALIANIRATFATETDRGTAEIATQAETNTGTDDQRFITPLKLVGRTPTEVRSGVIEIATQAETTIGTDDVRAITPLKLAQRIADEAWTSVGVSPVFQNSWVNYNSGTHGVARFRKTFNNMIELTGLINSGATGTVAFTLPVGYRPVKIEVFSCACDVTGEAFITVNTSGDVGITFSGTPVFFSLNSVRFPIN